MEYNDYKKYDGRWICNRCKEFIPQIKIRRASREADKKRNSFCQKCRIEGTQFSIKKSYPFFRLPQLWFLILTFPVWCVWAYFYNNAINEGFLDDESVYNGYYGWFHGWVTPLLHIWIIIEICTAYFQRRNRRTIRKLSRKPNKTSTKEKAHLPKEVRRAR